MKEERLIIGKVCDKEVVLEGKALKFFNKLGEKQKKEFIDEILHKLATRFILEGQE